MFLCVGFVFVRPVSSVHIQINMGVLFYTLAFVAIFREALYAFNCISSFVKGFGYCLCQSKTFLKWLQS